MFRKQFVTACLALVAVCGRLDSPSAGGEHRLVGEWSDPNRLEIRGSETFSPEAVRRAVLLDDQVMLAGHPAASLAGYVDRIRCRTLAGYRHAGFPEASVDAGLDEAARRLVVRVSEGPRFVAGEIVVLGAATIPVDAFVARLREPYPPERALPESDRADDSHSPGAWVDTEGRAVELKTPVWEPGKPARFAGSRAVETDAPPSSLRRAIESALADLGYPFARFAYEIVPDLERRTASLQVRLLDEGPSPIVQHVEVAGNQRNSREEILEYLALAPAASLDRGALASLHRALWCSGRFISWNIEPIRLPAEGDDAGAVSKEALGLRVEVCENPHGPRLAEEFSAEERILLKARHWLAHSEHWGADMILAWPNVGAIVSPHRGWILWACDATGEHLHYPFHHAAMATTDAVSLHALGHGARLDLRSVQGNLTGQFAFILTSAPEDEERPTRFSAQFGFLFSFTGGEKEPLVRLNLSLAPAAFVAIAHDLDARCEIRDGVLWVVDREGATWRIDAATGRIVEIRFDAATPSVGPSEGGAPGGAADAPAGLRLYFEPEAFERREAEILAATAAHRPEPGAARPVRSLARFLLSEWFGPGLGSSSDDTLAARRAIEAILARGPLDPLDEALLEVWAPGDASDAFDIPGDTSADILVPHLRPRAVRLVDHLFPQHSWPWTLGRGAVLEVSGHSQWTAADLERLYQWPETGPLCSVVVAHLLTPLAPAASRAFAELGLETLSRERFRDDCRPWLDDRGAIGRSVAGLAEAIRALHQTEIDALVAAMPAPYRQYLAEACGVLRANPDRPTDEALGEVLDRLWEMGLKDRLRGALQDLDVRFASCRDAGGVGGGGSVGAGSRVAGCTQ